jgi:hypothetical protein
VLTLALLLAAASPVPAESRQMVLSVSAGWDQSRAILQPYERSSPDTPWVPKGALVEGALGRSRRPASSTCAS